MDRTETAIRKLLTALPAPGYDLGILNAQGMYRLEAVPHARILRMLPYLKYRNATGAHIYIRPTGESPYTLLDDLTATSLTRLTAEGYAPAAVVETSPGNFQGWLRHAQPLSKELGTLAAKVLAVQFGADTNAADWRRFGRAAGFTNRKPQHCTEQGLYPVARLISHSGEPFAAATGFVTRLLNLQKSIKEQRMIHRQRYAVPPSRIVCGLTLSRFRRSARYEGRPAAADLAFSIAACSQGWAEKDIAAALSIDYLSRDTSQSRKAAYIRRTISKALQWLG
ncbi:MAG: RepB family DNA primase [Janthinobacterium lividum]